MILRRLILSKCRLYSPMACSSPCRSMYFFKNDPPTPPSHIILCKVFLSVCVVPLPRIPPDERYIVNKVRAVEGITSFFTSITHDTQIFPGFYGVTYYIGFRDDFDVKVWHQYFLFLLFYFILIMDFWTCLGPGSGWKNLCHWKTVESSSFGNASWRD